MQSNICLSFKHKPVQEWSMSAVDLTMPLRIHCCSPWCQAQKFPWDLQNPIQETLGRRKPAHAQMLFWTARMSTVPTTPFDWKSGKGRRAEQSNSRDITWKWELSMASAASPAMPPLTASSVSDIWCNFFLASAFKAEVPLLSAWLSSCLLSMLASPANQQVKLSTALLLLTAG